jgi:hypothetical protein
MKELRNWSGLVIKTRKVIGEGRREATILEKG